MIWIQDSDHSDLRFVSLCSVDTVSHQIDGIFNDVFWNAYAKLISNIKVDVVLKVCEIHCSDFLWALTVKKPLYDLACQKARQLIEAGSFGRGDFRSATVVGMVGAERSVLGRDVTDVLYKFTTGMPGRLNVVEKGVIRLDAAVITYDHLTGRASAIRPISREFAV